MSTKLTKNGVTTTKAPGQEQYETFTSKIGRKPQKRVAYDYRDHDGELFSCVKPTLDACREARDAWLEKKAGRRETENPKCTHKRKHPCEECSHYYSDNEGGRPCCHNNEE